LEKAGVYTLDLGGEAFDLTMEDVSITSEDIEGWMVASDAEITVALDVKLTPELEAEGMARELVNRIQNLRKDKGFEVTDRIVLTLENHTALNDALTQFKDYVCAEVLATELNLVDDLPTGDEVELIDGVNLKMSVVKS